MRDEPAQDYADLLQLVAALRALLLRRCACPCRRAYRRSLPAPGETPAPRTWGRYCTAEIPVKVGHRLTAPALCCIRASLPRPAPCRRGSGGMTTIARPASTAEATRTAASSLSVGPPPRVAVI